MFSIRLSFKATQQLKRVGGGLCQEARFASSLAGTQHYY